MDRWSSVHSVLLKWKTRLSRWISLWLYKITFWYFFGLDKCEIQYQTKRKILKVIGGDRLGQCNSIYFEVKRR
jgi:hypothetical protein